MRRSALVDLACQGGELHGDDAVGLHGDERDGPVGCPVCLLDHGGETHDRRVAQDLLHLADIQYDIRARAVDQHGAHRLDAAEALEVQVARQQLGALDGHGLGLDHHDQLVALVQDGVESRVEAGADIQHHHGCQVGEVGEHRVQLLDGGGVFHVFGLIGSGQDLDAEVGLDELIGDCLHADIGDFLAEQVRQPRRVGEVEVQRPRTLPGFHLGGDHLDVVLLGVGDGEVERHGGYPGATRGGKDADHVALVTQYLHLGELLRQQVADVCLQVDGVDGLGQVEVDARVVPRQLVLDGGLGGEHEDGRGGGFGVAAQVAAYLVAIHAGHHHVEDDQVGMFHLDAFQGFHAGGG